MAGMALADSLASCLMGKASTDFNRSGSEQLSSVDIAAAL